VIPLAAPLDMTGAGLAMMIFLGLVLLPASFGFLTLAPRYIPAPEVSLLLLLETVLGPLLVWAAIGEAISESTLVGGAIVLIALAANAAVTLLKYDYSTTQPIQEGEATSSMARR
jgi:drug/metabolite transporter (DMT)-like permease